MWGGTSLDNSHVLRGRGVATFLARRAAVLTCRSAVSNNRPASPPKRRDRRAAPSAHACPTCALVGGPSPLTRRARFAPHPPLSLPLQPSVWKGMGCSGSPGTALRSSSAHSARTETRGRRRLRSSRRAGAAPPAAGAAAGLAGPHGRAQPRSHPSPAPPSPATIPPGADRQYRRQRRPWPSAHPVLVGHEKRLRGAPPLPRPSPSLTPVRTPRHGPAHTLTRRHRADGLCLLSPERLPATRLPSRVLSPGGPKVRHHSPVPLHHQAPICRSPFRQGALGAGESLASPARTGRRRLCPLGRWRAARARAGSPGRRPTTPRRPADTPQETHFWSSVIRRDDKTNYTMDFARKTGELFMKSAAPPRPLCTAAAPAS